ncbi:MAG: Ig-like domain-containing protein, partial [Acidimicrobiaceae bacterium]
MATKTIRLCTGDADCATPVETFTLPSASVTSASGGMRVVIDPEANLTASTTYFLLIDSGAFVDGAGNPTASAVTAGQFQFTASLPPIVSGGGSSGGGSSGGTTGGSLPGFNPPILILPNNGVIATCGPPPLPPCNVGPGINFGPGGLIQNPNALIGADMANLRPDNFVGFRPDDARLLGAGALQNFQPSQFGALPPTAMAGFDRN